VGALASRPGRGANAFDAGWRQDVKRVTEHRHPRDQTPIELERPYGNATQGECRHASTASRSEVTYTSAPIASNRSRSTGPSDEAGQRPTTILTFGALLRRRRTTYFSWVADPIMSRYEKTIAETPSRAICAMRSLATAEWGIVWA